MPRNNRQSFPVSSASESSATHTITRQPSRLRCLPAVLLFSAFLLGSSPVFAGIEAAAGEQPRTTETEPSLWDWLQATWNEPEPAFAAPAGKDDGSEEDPEAGTG